MKQQTNGKQVVKPPKTWATPDHHLQALLSHEWYKCILKLFSQTLLATHSFYAERNIYPCVFPVTTGSVSSPMGIGSDSIPIKINMHGHEIFLADSMQFALELGTRLNHTGMYYVMPSFRGEDVDQRHLNEFIHSEVEIPGTLEDILTLGESYLISLAKHLSSTCATEIQATAGSIEHVVKLAALPGRFHRLKYEDALQEIKGIKDAVRNVKSEWSVITPLGERALVNKFGDFVWLTHMPWLNVPFYQAKEAGTNSSLTGDLLAGIGEILGCGQRINDVDDLLESYKFHHVDRQTYAWYTQMRQLAPLQTAGFGLGIERFLMWVTQTDDIRDCCLIYRDHSQVIYP